MTNIDQVWYVGMFYRRSMVIGWTRLSPACLQECPLLKKLSRASFFAWSHVHILLIDNTNSNFILQHQTHDGNNSTSLILALIRLSRIYSHATTGSYRPPRLHDHFHWPLPTMGKETPNAPTLGKMNKLPPIPKGARVQKRPIMKRQAQRAGPSANSSRVVYVSSSTPFMAAMKRVRKKLDASLRAATAVDRRAAPKGLTLGYRIDRLKREVAAAAAAASTADPSSSSSNNSDRDGNGEGYEVVVMGTGKAVEKVVGLAGWFEQEADCVVEVRTRTVGTVDDVVVAEDDEEGEDGSRVRKMSCLEVSVRLR